jgi:hypothetical protein
VPASTKTQVNASYHNKPNTKSIPSTNILFSRLC